MIGHFRRLRAVLRPASFPRDLPLFWQCLRRRTCHEEVPAALATRLEGIRGWLTPGEAGLLYRFAHTWPLPGPVIELGSYAGKSAVVFANAGRRVFAVDAWTRDTLTNTVSGDAGGQMPAVDTPTTMVEHDTIWSEFQENLAAELRAQQVVAARGMTQEVASTWKQSCALLYVDAGHEYADVRADLDLWTRFILPGGVLLMHDVFTFPGVTRAAGELVRAGWRVVGFTNRAAAFVRVGEGKN